MRIACAADSGAARDPEIDLADWRDVPWARGAYPLLAPGEHTVIGRTLSELQAGLGFCGHVSPAHVGDMEAAAPERHRRCGAHL